MIDIYTQLETAASEIKQRWSDKGLEKEVAEYLKNDIPDFLLSKPHIVIFRNITTANLESERLIELSKKTGLDFISLEYNQDKFVSFNPDKYDILMQKINLEKKNNGEDVMAKIKIADINTVQGKQFKDIKTRWGEDLTDFHHNILFRRYPEFKGKTYDISDWLQNNGGKARLYYEKFIVLLMRNCILAECFEFKGDEERFIEEVIHPAFKKAESTFNLRPLIVQLAPKDKELDPNWWYPKKEMRDLIKGYIMEYKHE